MDQKGQLGIETATTFILAILVIFALAFAVLVANSALEESTILTSLSGNFTNQTITLNNNNSEIPEAAGLDTVVFANLALTNATGDPFANHSGGINVTLDTGNFTTNAEFIVGTTDSEFNNSRVNVSGTFTYTSSNTKSIEGNISQGIDTFFADAGTWFALLAVMIIILVVGIVILATRKFGGSVSSGI